MAVYTEAQFQSAIATYSAKRGINPWVTSSVIMQESRWQQYPRDGAAGEVGPMQVIPAGKAGSAVTDAIRAGYLSKDALSEEWLRDPVNNVQAGTAILRAKADMFVSKDADLNSKDVNKDIYNTVKAYNGAGPRAEAYANSVTTGWKPKVDEAMANRDENGVHAVPSGANLIEDNTTGDIRSSTIMSNSVKVGTDFSIMNFAKFIATRTFYQYMQKAYEQNLEMSLHGFLTKFMSRFYHLVHYVPTLPNCMAILVKPETQFINAPSCNVLYPTMKSSIEFSRNFNAEPTRLLVSSDPIAGMFNGGNAGKIGVVNTLVMMDYKTGTKEERVVGVNVLKSRLGEEKKKPLVNCSDYEMDHGIRTRRLMGGDDFYLYMIGEPGKASKKAEDRLLKVTKDIIDAASATLLNLASYHLLKLRYDSRQGSSTMFFNPYIVPGFPMVSIEGTHETTLNVKAYVTSVSHSLSPSGATTSVTYSGAHIGTEPKPSCMPIVEAEYEKGSAAIYKGMFGEAVTEVTDAEVIRKKFAEQKGSVSETLKTIWRPLTTDVEYMAVLAHGAKLDESGVFAVMTSNFFDTGLQSKLKEYSKRILVDKDAYYETDVR